MIVKKIRIGKKSIYIFSSQIGSVSAIGHIVGNTVNCKEVIPKRNTQYTIEQISSMKGNNFHFTGVGKSCKNQEEIKKEAQEEEETAQKAG